MIKKNCVIDCQTWQGPYPQGSFKIVKVAKKIKATTEGLSNITWEQTRRRNEF